jgi:hypothetical protein
VRVMSMTPRRRSRPSQIVSHAAAVARYEADQLRLENHADKLRAQRALGIAAIVSQSVSKAASRFHAQRVDMGRPCSSIVVDMVLYATVQAFVKVRSFFGAHALLWLWPWGKHYSSRVATCAMCSFQRPDAYGYMRCGAENEGKGCGCLQSPV